MVTRTKKLEKAAAILTLEQYADTSIEDFITYANRLKVTNDMVYKLMARWGYRWAGGRWVQPRPSWFTNIEYRSLGLME